MGVRHDDTARWVAAVVGTAATGVALGAAELLAGAVDPAASPVLAIANRVVDLAPPPVKTTAVAVFGEADKVALLIGTLVLAAAFGAGLGLLARWRFVMAAAGFAAFGLLGVAAAAGEARASVVATALVVAVAVAVGVLLLHRLQRRSQLAPTATGRRAVLRLSLWSLAGAAVAGWTGRWLSRGAAAEASRREVAVPAPEQTVAPLSPDAQLDVAGVEPFVTPNADFYRIDTALAVPRIDVDTWSLRVTGMVDRPLEWRFDELVGRGLVEHWTTLACVSNEVGGHLIGNARWGGVPLRDVLDLAGVQLGATQIVGRSADGWTAGFPTAVAYDGREALVAVTMNGEPLPIEHGFPARLVVPGLYGYVSATKWLTEIELTTLDAFDAYWVPRGWAKEAPIKTQSRIDVPRPGTVAPGVVAVAGVAWAQGRGISNVEIQVDDGPWEAADLGDTPNDDTWRQWVAMWDAEPGSHVLQVRATDATGEVQTAQRQGVMPDGATGYHRVLVQVAEA